MIRLMEPDRDAAAVMDGARDFIARMDYRDFLPGTEDELVDAVGRVLALPGMEPLVAEHDGRICGGIGMLHAPLIWNPSVTGADELFWWGAPDAPPTTALRLLRASRSRARQNGARLVTFKQLASSPPGVARVYRRMGLVPVETSWMGPA